MALHRFSFPTQIFFGAGARSLVGEHLIGLGLRRPLIVTDRGIAPLPMLSDLEYELRAVGLQPAIFSEIWGNPVKSQVTAGVAEFFAGDCDSIIGLGGGAALDVAKAIALMTTHPGDLFDYEDEKPGARPVNGAVAYWVALPTTSGTGSEVGRSSVISDDQTHLKKIIFSPKLLARAVFADPELTLALPASVTAATGMDALTHCVEAYLAKGFHPICDGIALEGLRLAAKSLARAVREPSNLDARSDMMMASMMGAIAFQKGLGLTHSCAHALGTVADLHHGLANGIMIDFALSHNVETSADRFRTLAQVVGLPIATPGMFLEWLRDLKASLGIPLALRGAGVRPEQLSELIRIATEDSCHQNNPRVCTSDDFARIFERAMSGQEQAMSGQHEAMHGQSEQKTA
jgi:alcohol dehydrogenase class IV